MADNPSECKDMQSQVSEHVIDEIALAFHMAESLSNDKNSDISCNMTQAHLLGLKVNELNEQLIGKYENSVHSTRLNWQYLKVLFYNNNTNLTSKCLEMLMASTKFNKEKISDWHSRLLHECPNGKLSKNQFIQNYQQLFPNGKAKDFCKYVFAVFDRDNTETIEFYEFMLSLGLTQSNDPFLRFGIAFDMHNYNDTETVGVNELTKAFTTLFDLNGISDRKGDGDPKHRAEEMIRMCDAPD